MFDGNSIVSVLVKHLMRCLRINVVFTWFLDNLNLKKGSRAAKQIKKSMCISANSEALIFFATRSVWDVWQGNTPRELNSCLLHSLIANINFLKAKNIMEKASNGFDAKRKNNKYTKFWVKLTRLKDLPTQIECEMKWNV